MRAVHFGSAAMAFAGVALMAGAARADVKAGVDAWQAGDFGRAVAEWRPLAEKGDADAQFNLGQAYKLGNGVPKNVSVAQEWFGKAAGQGHEQAQATLGLILFQNGDRAAAMPWLKKAAEAGEPRAQYIYGTALYNGDVVSRDMALAYAMMSRAAAAGLPQATNSLAVMDQRMAQPDKTRGQELAAALPSLAIKPVLATDRPGTPLATAGAAPAESRGAPRLAANTNYSLPPSSKTAAATPAAKPPVPPAKPAPAAAPAPAPAPAAPKAAAAKPTPEKPPVKTAEAKPAPAKPAPAAPAAKPGGPWRVQLGAFSSPAAARAAWGKYSGSAALGGRTPSYVAAGKFTRLQVSGFASQAAAQKACAALGSCIPVRP